MTPPDTKTLTKKQYKKIRSKEIDKRVIKTLGKTKIILGATTLLTAIAASIIVDYTGQSGSILFVSTALVLAYLSVDVFEIQIRTIEQMKQEGWPRVKEAYR